MSIFLLALLAKIELRACDTFIQNPDNWANPTYLTNCIKLRNLYFWLLISLKIPPDIRLSDNLLLLYWFFSSRFFLQLFSTNFLNGFRTVRLFLLLDHQNFLSLVMNKQLYFGGIRVSFLLKLFRIKMIGCFLGCLCQVKMRRHIFEIRGDIFDHVLVAFLFLQFYHLSIAFIDNFDQHCI